MIVRDATSADLPAILAILNEAIAHSTAVWSLAPATLSSRRAWLDERQGRGLPVLVAVDGEEVLGFASFGDFRPFEGYLHSVEHSVYVAKSARGRGVGQALLEALVERARAMGKHVMIAGIEAGNATSIRLHARLGFVETGRMPEVGRKFDRWLDLVLMQRIL
jgi:phosphinothricin acetyltransferase